MIKSALAIYNRLMEQGEINNKTDSELYFEFKKEEVRAILYQFEDELNFKLLEVGSTVYIIPDMDNEILGYVMREFREGISSNARMVDAYLQIYICLTIFHMFYGGKNTNPIQREFIQTKDLLENLDHKMENYLKDEEKTVELEAGYNMNFMKVATLWVNKQIGEGAVRKSKWGTITKAYNQLEKEKLIRILQDGNEIRRTKRLDDLFIYYYLDEARVQEIHQLFEKEV